MPAVLASPRDPAPRTNRTDAVLWTGMVGLVTIVLLVAAWAGIDHGCKVSPPPLDGPPDSGTPRASYCDALSGALRWTGLVVIPAALTGAITLRFHRRLPILPKTVAVLVCSAALANWISFDHLDWALTV